MRVYVYTGTTLARDEAKKILDAEAHFLPPVKHGDVLDALYEGADCIAIIDGYYDVVAACRHKEILQALEAGVRVLGSSSFGAIRAAELTAFGMEGFGKIYQMYAEGSIDGDDEVAIKHAPESEGFKSLSIPLVDLRDNLRRAVEAGIIDLQSADLIIDCAKQMYFGARTLKRIFAGAAGRGIDNETVERCRDRFQKHWHSLKVADARLLLETLNARLHGCREWPALQPLHVNKTNFLYRWNVERARVETSLGFIREHEVIAQLKFATEKYPKARQTANERAWLGDFAERLNIKLSDEEAAFFRSQFREREKIENDSDEEAWLAGRALTLEQLADVLQTEASIAKHAASHSESAPSRSRLLLEYARLRGLSTRPSEIEAEWRSYWRQLKVDELNNDCAASVDLSEPPLKQPAVAPDRSEWCRLNNIDPEKLNSCLGERSLLRKLASNYYIRPGILCHESIIVELKMSGLFHKALDELVSIYEFITRNGVSAAWHPQWKVFVQPDTRAVLEWFCRKERLHPKMFQDYIHWKGFGELQEFLDIAQLNHIHSMK